MFLVTRTPQLQAFNTNGLLVINAGYNAFDVLQMTPRLIHKLANKHIMSISVGAECSAAMDAAGLVYVWGRADSGQVSM